MARIRSAKPDFWTDPLMVSLPREIRFTFKGLWEVCADDFGRFLADARVVKGKVWPMDDDLTPKKIDRFLTTLAERKRIVLYSQYGVRYGYIVNWLKHQRVSHPSPSIFPDPPPELLANDSRAIPERLASDSVLSGAERSGVERSRVERSGAESGNGSESENRSGEPTSTAGDWIPPSELARRDPSPDFEHLELDDADLDPDPLIREHDRQPLPPAPLVGALVELPVEAHRFVEQLYSLATQKRQLDVRRQLYDALNPTSRGARLRKGVFVKARSAEHLAACCRAVMEDPPRNVDAAIVIVLEKLQDPPPGPTPAEQHKADSDADRAEEDAYQRDAKSAGVRWAHDHPDEYQPIVAEIDAHFKSAPDSGFTRMAREAALAQKCAEAAGFPSFDVWRTGHKTPVQNGARSGANGGQTRQTQRLAAGGGR